MKLFLLLAALGALVTGCASAPLILPAKHPPPPLKGENRAAYVEANRVESAPLNYLVRGTPVTADQLRRYFIASGCPQAAKAMDRIPPSALPKSLLLGAVTGAGTFLASLVFSNWYGPITYMDVRIGVSASVGALAAIGLWRDFSQDTAKGVSVFNAWLESGEDASKAEKSGP